jgi:N-acetylmuramoyl-L-alanine amidase
VTLPPPVELPSPNHGARPPGIAVDILVLHYTGMTSGAAALERLCNPGAKVSAHFCIDEDGTVYRLVPEQRRAWHAGVSAWAGTTDVNARSIGIELVNPGHEWGYRDFTAAQMAALEPLARDIVRRHGVPPERVLGHSDVAPMRKKDPGERFDWARLAAAGVGLWPHAEPAQGAGPSLESFLAGLRRFGYDAPDSTSERARAAVIAFQRHYRPWRIDGRPDAECAARLDALLACLDGRSPTP